MNKKLKKKKDKISYYLASCGFIFPRTIKELENFELLYKDYKIPENELLDPNKIIKK